MEAVEITTECNAEKLIIADKNRLIQTLSLPESIDRERGDIDWCGTEHDSKLSTEDTSVFDSDCL